MQKNIYHYTNSSGRCFYIHQRTNKNGTACYYLSSKREGNLIPEIPEGYEVWEHPETSGVFLRKKTDCLITKTENEYLHTSMEKLSRVKLFKIDIRKNEIVIYTSEVPDRHSALSDLHFFRPYQAMLRFTLEDKEKRLFSRIDGVLVEVLMAGSTSMIAQLWSIYAKSCCPISDGKVFTTCYK